MTRKEAKKAARGTLKRHYLLLVSLCLIAALVGREFALSATVFQSARTGRTPTVQTTVLPGAANAGRLIVRIVGDSDGTVRQLMERERQLAGQGGGALSRSSGVFAAILNKLQSGSYMASAYNVLRGLTGSDRAGLVLLVALSIALALLFWTFVENVYVAATCRVFLECRIYSQVPFSRVFWFVRLRRWAKTAGTLLMRWLFQALWSLTVVGGFVKHCAYFPVPYLVAENPELGWRRVLDVSKGMMAGHKWELLRFEFTFLGWHALSLLTFGATGVFYSKPYRRAALSHYYAHIRALWLAEHPEDGAVLDDRRLFRVADAGELAGAYADVPTGQAALPDLPRLPGVEGFLARNFGVLLRLGPRQRAYAQAVECRARLAQPSREAAGESYPLRLGPRRPRESARGSVTARAGRCYWIWSLVAIFFTCSVVGWVWEVFYAMTQRDELVNRGVLHGPWLPIYGAGVCLILLALYRFRSKPYVEFFLAVVLCGVLEYSTGLFLELTSGGLRWWDYSGYFLHLHRRVSAEGLLVFGLGGCGAVYWIAPRLDDLLGRAPKRALVAVCLTLSVLFVGDQAYSLVHPNAGPGITSSEAEAPGDPPPGA